MEAYGPRKGTTEPGLPRGLTLLEARGAGVSTGTDRLQAGPGPPLQHPGPSSPAASTLSHLSAPLPLEVS